MALDLSDTSDAASEVFDHSTMAAETAKTTRDNIFSIELPPAEIQTVKSVLILGRTSKPFVSFLVLSVCDFSGLRFILMFYVRHRIC